MGIIKIKIQKDDADILESFVRVTDLWQFKNIILSLNELSNVSLQDIIKSLQFEKTVKQDNSYLNIKTMDNFKPLFGPMRKNN